MRRQPTPGYCVFGCGAPEFSCRDSASSRGSKVLSQVSAHPHEGLAGVSARATDGRSFSRNEWSQTREVYPYTSCAPRAVASARTGCCLLGLQRLPSVAACRLRAIERPPSFLIHSVCCLAGREKWTIGSSETPFHLRGPLLAVVPLEGRQSTLNKCTTGASRWPAPFTQLRQNKISSPT